MHPRLDRLFAAARAADPAELEQAMLRVRTWFLADTYFIAAALWNGVIGEHELLVIATAITQQAITVLLLAWVTLWPGVNHTRRRAMVVFDVAALTFNLHLLGEPGTVLFGFYLWIIIGNGFRFGRWYLHYAQAIAIAGFALMAFTTPFWRELPVLDGAVLFLLLIVPVYVGVLIDRLQAARHEAETARRDAEAANAAKTRFLAAASHDLRQPMQALSMYASVLEERHAADAAGQRVVHGIQLSVKTLERLFDSLLDISKIESGVIKPCLASFPLMPLIEQVVEAERPLAVQKGLALRMARASAWVQSDPALLERMLKNLVVNAIRYTERGGIVVGCRRAGVAGLRLEIVDSGIGIESQEHQRIFDDYYQVDGASGQGLGLGLPIVKSLGELLGHRVTVRSAPGRGSIFSIELPVAAPAPLAVADAPGPGAMATGRVVLVDDDVEIRRSMQLLLEGWGYEIVSGATLADVEATLGAKGLRPDALIVDYRLAGAMTGGQVIERLRAAFGAELPALVITGNANVAAVRERVPGIPIAVKPVLPGKLRAFLAQALSAP